MSLLSIEELARATSDEINLISCVGLLQVVTDRLVKLNHKRAMGKDGHCKIAGRGRAFGEGFSKTNMHWELGRFHVRLCLMD